MPRGLSGLQKPDEEGEQSSVWTLQRRNRAMVVLTFRLSLSTDELLRYYRGDAKSVRALTVDGRSVQFPANVLREHVTPEGVYGTFSLRVDGNNRLVDFKRVA